jgi:alkanesulfonate monooxygenase SsuD/methylene tetrahydromethanopterin reductase-like flavin-dependent oxidoreductase (luciferase family)
MKVSFLAANAYEGPAPGIEIWPAPPRFCDPVIASQSFQDTLTLSARAESLGFDWISVSEHHYAPYMMTPNPMVFAGALTQVTKRVRIALLGPLIPLVNPVRLAEELSMLDAMSGGRLEVLFLRGTPNEHKTYDTRVKDTRAMTQEGIDLVLKTWAEQNPFAWQGEYYQFSQVSVWPKPLQQPHPPVYGSGNSEESVIFAAQRKMGIAFSFAPPEVVKKWVALYYQEAEKCGWLPQPDQVIYRGIAFPAESDDKAQQGMAAFFGEQAQLQARFKSEMMGGPPVVPLISEPYFVGGPETLIERFGVLRDCGVGVVDMAFGIGSYQQRAEALEIFGEQVLPTVRSF